MLQSFFLLSLLVICNVMLQCLKDVRRLHGTAAFRAQDALYHYAAAHVKRMAIITKPVINRYLIDAITPLMHWNVASSTEDDLVLIFVLSTVADCALCILLDYETSFVSTE